jgi:hypothetical protein
VVVVKGQARSCGKRDDNSPERRRNGTGIAIIRESGMRLQALACVHSGTRLVRGKGFAVPRSQYRCSLAAF